MLDKSYSLSVEAAAELGQAAETRMADLAAFSRGIVHDLRNPLNVIVANVYLLRQRLAGEDPRAARPVERIGEQVKALENLLNGYLAFEQAGSPSMQRVHLNDVVRTVVEGITLGEGCQIELSLDETLPLVDADPRLLESSLRALIRNSLRAMENEGSLRIITGGEPGCVFLAVEDSGPGIPEEGLPRVFEPFFSTWEEHAGMGLPLAAKVARAHGGRALLETRPGGGTRVSLQLPTE